MAHEGYPSRSPPTPTPTPTLAGNESRAFEDFERLFGVGAILDPDDPHCCADEKANITYLAELMKAIPVHEDDDEDGDGGSHRRRAIKEKDPRKVNQEMVWLASTALVFRV